MKIFLIFFQKKVMFCGFEYNKLKEININSAPEIVFILSLFMPGECCGFSYI